MMHPRQKALQEGAQHYFTGKPCRNGHIDKRNTSDAVCMSCAKEKATRWNELNREKYLAGRLRSNNKVRHKNQMYAKQWREQYPEKHRERIATYRAAKSKRTPLWANHTEIKMFYEAAEILSRGGVMFHVDHIVPLNGKNVSGFHVENNLQILPWHQNLQKSNNFTNIKLEKSNAI